LLALASGELLSPGFAGDKKDLGARLTVPASLHRAGSISAHPGLPGSPGPQQGCPETCSRAGISQPVCAEQGFPRPALPVGKRLRGHLCSGDRGAL